MHRVVFASLIFLSFARCHERDSDDECELYTPSATDERTRLERVPVDTAAVSAASCGRESCSNLLQVSSKRSSQPSVAVQHPDGNASQGLPQSLDLASSDSHSRYMANGEGGPRAAIARVAVAHLITFADTVSSRPSILLAGLIFLVAACILFFMVRSVRYDDERPKHGSGPPRQGSPVVVQARSPLLSHANAMSPSSSGFVHRTVASPPRITTSVGSSSAYPAPSFPPASSQQLPVSSRHLCPGLVVPSQNECHLAVPVLSASRSSSMETVAFDVQDLEGKCVIKAEAVLPFSSRVGFENNQRPYFVLRAGNMPGVAHDGGGRPLLAYCKITNEMAPRKRVCIYDRCDELFAMVMKDTSGTRYVVSSGRASLQLYVEGDAEKQTLRVTNDQRQLLAETTPETMSFNPGGSYYKLRVASDIDVGLVLCALFSVYRLELA